MSAINRTSVTAVVALGAVAVGLAMLAGPVQAGSGTLNPTDDTYTARTSPSSTHGSDRSLYVKSGSNERRAYFKFVVPTIPAGASRITASLRLWSQQSTSSGVFTVKQTDSSWSEATLTWNNQPAPGTTIATRTGLPSGYVSWDVSSYVTGPGTWAMALTSSTTNQRAFTSKEGSATQRPQLIVSWNGGGSAPTVTTGTATNLTTATATLNGTVNPNGLATTCHFDYGTSTSYGSATANDTSPGAGTTTVNVSTSLAGLSANTTHHYRLSCSSSGGTSNGSDATFTTAANQVAPTVTTSAASGITQTGATLNGTVNPNGQATTYQFEYGTSTSYGSVVPATTGSAGSGSSAVNESASVTGLTAGTTYHYRLNATNATGTTHGSDATFTTVAAATSVLNSKLLIYGSEIGAWQTDGGPAANESTGVPTKVREAGVSVIRFAVYDCFTDMTCGSDNHTGTISRTSFDHAITHGVMANNAVLWLKMTPIAEDVIGGVDGTTFCPPWTGDASGNLAMYKAVVAEARNAGYTGSLIIESNNEMEYACWAKWQSEGAPISSAGSVGVSKRIGEHYAATMPALKAYAQTLGFSEVVVGGYLGVSGGPGWGQNCTADATEPYGYACGYSTRWVSEFATAVHDAYVAHGNDPLHIPDFMSMHAYVHGPDFSSTRGYEFDDNIAYAYYRNWLVQSRSVVDGIWGATIGDQIRFSISEWQAGVSNSSGTWSGWTVSGRPGQLYDGWYDMLRGDGNTTGSGTRYWNADLFLIAGNSDTGSGRYYNWIHQDGTVPDWYANIKAKMLNDPLRGGSGACTGFCVTVSGNHLVDGNGSVVQLRGVNRSGTQYACSEGWGIFDGPNTDANLDAMKTWHVNAVRVSLNDACWLGVNGVPSAYGGVNYQNAIKDYVNRITAKGMYAIVDLHFANPGTTLQPDQVPMADRDHANDFWSGVATAFKSNPAVLFDLFNEPYPDSNSNTTAAWTCVRDGGTCPGVSYTAAGSQEMLNAIRNAGATNVVLVGGPQYAGVVNQWTTYKPSDPAGQLAASIHIYYNTPSSPDWSPCYQQSCWDNTMAPLANTTPVVIGEYGEHDCSYGLIGGTSLSPTQQDLLSWSDAHGVSYLAWAWFAGNCAAEPALISSYTGTPTAYGQGVRSHYLAAAGRPLASALIGPCTTSALPCSWTGPRATAQTDGP